MCWRCTATCSTRTTARASPTTWPGITSSSPEATDGLGGIGDFLDWLKRTHPGHRNHIQRVFAQDDHVIVHLRVTVPGETDLAVVDIFRLNAAGLIAEHWDIVQRVPENPKNANGMF